MIIQHCDLLDRGMTEWENWREEFPEQSPILNWIVRPEAELRYFDLSSASMCGANLEGSDFEKADCSGADFCGAVLNDSSFANTNCEGASFKGSNLENANFKGAILKGATFFGANLKGCDFRDAFLDGVDFTGAILTEAHFEGTTMLEVNMSYSDMSNALLASDESPIRVKRTVFEGVDLRHAILEGANLMGVIFQNVNFSGARLARISLGKTVFADCNLSGAIGLDEIDHIEPSTLGLDTLLKSEGDIPESFMVDAGIPEAFVEILTGNQPADQDTAFERSLVANDLVQNGFAAHSSQNDSAAQEVMEQTLDEQDDAQPEMQTDESAEQTSAQAEAENEAVTEQGVEVGEPSWPFEEQDDSSLAHDLANAELSADDEPSDNYDQENANSAEEETESSSMLERVTLINDEISEQEQSENDDDNGSESVAEVAGETPQMTDSEETHAEAESTPEHTLTGFGSAVSS